MWSRSATNCPAGVESKSPKISVLEDAATLPRLQQLRAHLNWRQWDARTRRVMLLVAGVIILSLADLVITVTFLRANWMMEANPIAAYLIRTTQSFWALVALKAVSVSICVGLLLKLRQYIMGEVAAWFAVGILAVMSVMWHSYSQQFDDPQHMALVQAATEDLRLGLP